MNPIPFPGAERLFTAPREWDSARHGECSGLHVMRRDDVFISSWAPTWKERIQILLGWPVFLHIVGGQPPVALTVDRREKPVA